MSFGNCCCGQGTEVVNPFGSFEVQFEQRYWGFPSFLNAFQYEPATGGNVGPRHGVYPCGGIRLTFADINAAAPIGMTRLGGIVEQPPFDPSEFAAHPEVGYLLASCVYNTGAWVGPNRETRTDRWTGGIFEHETGAIIRRRSGPNASSFWRCILPTHYIVNGVYGAQGRDPQNLDDWWIPTTDPGDAGVTCSYHVTQFTDYPQWGTFNDIKFLIRNSALLLYRVIREGTIAGDAIETDSGHLQRAIPASDLALPLRGIIRAHFDSRAGTWGPSVVDLTPFLPTPNFGRAVSAGDIVTRGDGQSAQSHYPYFMAIANGVLGADPATDANWLVIGSIAAFEDAVNPEAQPIAALTTSNNPAITGLVDRDWNLAGRWLSFEARTRFVSLWGYQDGLSSVDSLKADHVATYTADPGTGNIDWQRGNVVHPLAQPTIDLLTGSASKGVLRVYNTIQPSLPLYGIGVDVAIGPNNSGHTNYVEWQGARPKFIRPGDYIDVEVWRDWTDDDFDKLSNPNFEFVKVGTWRCFAQTAMAWPMPPRLDLVPHFIDRFLTPDADGYITDVEQTTLGATQYISTWICCAKHRDYTACLTLPHAFLGTDGKFHVDVEPFLKLHPSDLVMSTIDFNVEDMRSIDQVRKCVYPFSPPGCTVDDFASEQDTQRIIFAGGPLAWARLHVIVDGAEVGTNDINPLVAVKVSLAITNRHTRERMIALCQDGVSKLDLSKETSSTIANWISQVCGPYFSVARRFDWRYSAYFTNCAKVRDPDGNEACTQINIRQPGISLRQIDDNRCEYLGPDDLKINRINGDGGSDQFELRLIGSSPHTPGQICDARILEGCLCAP